MSFRTVVCPFVDVIDCDTFEYRPQDEGARGSFDWSFNYKRLPITKDDEKNPTRPFNSPVSKLLLEVFIVSLLFSGGWILCNIDQVVLGAW